MPLRNNASMEELKYLILKAVASKPARHHLGEGKTSLVNRKSHGLEAKTQLGSVRMIDVTQDSSVEVTVSAKAIRKTGFELEALAAVAVSALIWVKQWTVP